MEDERSLGFCGGCVAGDAFDELSIALGSVADVVFGRGGR
jgi:hypothetical protein